MASNHGSSVAIEATIPAGVVEEEQNLKEGKQVIVVDALPNQDAEAVDGVDVQSPSQSPVDAALDFRQDGFEDETQTEHTQTASVVPSILPNSARLDGADGFEQAQEMDELSQQYVGSEMPSTEQVAAPSSPVAMSSIFDTSAVSPSVTAEHAASTAKCRTDSVKSSADLESGEDTVNEEETSPMLSIPRATSFKESVEKDVVLPRLELENELKSARSAGDTCKTPGFSTDSTCAASNFSGGTGCDQRLSSVLKVSPPQPLGRVAGRFKICLWRASITQPYGISFTINKTGLVVIATDAPHLGLRRNDELISLNGQYVNGIQQCVWILAGTLELEMHLYHREISTEESVEHAPLCGAYIEPHELPVCFDPCCNPPEPKCKAESWPLRSVLQTTGPIPTGGNGVFSVDVVKASRRVLFGVKIAAQPQGITIAEPSGAAQSSSSSASRIDCVGFDGTVCEIMSRSSSVDHSEQAEDARAEPAAISTATSSSSAPSSMFIKEDIPHLGLKEGDEVLQINGRPANNIGVCKAALANSMVLSMELRRPGERGLVGRLQEPSMAGDNTSQNAPIQPVGQTWLSVLMRRLGVRLCCMGQTSVYFGEEPTGADQSHDLDVNKVSVDERCVQAV